jgi:hypothetical protein
MQMPNPPVICRTVEKAGFGCLPEVMFENAIVRLSCGAEPVKYRIGVNDKAEEEKLLSVSILVPRRSVGMHAGIKIRMGRTE